MKIGIKRIDSINGKVKISGSKNTALPIICASLLTNKTITLKNVPMITDVLILLDIIKEIGCNVKINKKNGTVKIKAKRVTSTVLTNKVTKLRGSYYLIGTLLARYHKCIISYPGGCSFTSRPIDYHIDVFNQLGFEIVEKNKIIFIKEKRIYKNIIIIKNKSVGASINALLASSLIENQIIIKNILLEPEVLEVINYLRLLGKEIYINGEEIILTNSIENKSITFTITGDRIEAGSYMLLTSAFKYSQLEITNSPIIYLKEVINVVRQLGVHVEIEKDIIKIKTNDYINSINLVIKEYPSFPTDLQQILSVILLKANGLSTIEDKIYPSRISQIKELKKMKANIEYENSIIKIYPSTLVGTEVVSHDLRCSFALLLAGIVAEDETIIDNFELSFRGYENIIDKIKNLGIHINIYY